MSYKIMATNGTLKLLWNYICSDHLHLLSEKAISDIFSILSSAVSFLIMQQNKWHKEQYTLNDFMISNIEVFVDPTYSSPVPVCFFTLLIQQLINTIQFFSVERFTFSLLQMPFCMVLWFCAFKQPQHVWLVFTFQEAQKCWRTLTDAHEKHSTQKGHFMSSRDRLICPSIPLRL